MGLLSVPSRVGTTEILASPVLVGRDRTASLDRTMHLLGRVAQSIPQD
jgi:hypothetical protein